MNMRDKIEDILWDSFYNGNNGQNITDGVEAVIAALPDMIKPLVWIEFGGIKGMHSGRYVVQHEHDETGKGAWVVGFDGFFVSDQKLKTDAQAAANTHHRAAIMAAFTGEDT
jgi:hypothetical protein